MLFKIYGPLFRSFLEAPAELIMKPVLFLPGEY